MSKILVVCLGNICRSPMAEGLLKAKINNPKFSISSAGINAMAGKSAHATAAELLQKKGIDISKHIARQITTEMVVENDYIITMSNEQKKQVENEYPESYGKVFRLGQEEGFDIVDPYKRMPIIFEQSLAQIEYGLMSWYKLFV